MTVLGPGRRIGRFLLHALLGADHETPLDQALAVRSRATRREPVHSGE